MDKQPVGQASLLTDIDVLQVVTIDVSHGQPGMFKEIKIEVHFNPLDPVADAVLQLVAIGVVVTQGRHGAIDKQRWPRGVGPYLFKRLNTDPLQLGLAR